MSSAKLHDCWPEAEEIMQWETPVSKRSWETTVVQKLINANPRLKINQGVYFTTPKCCTTLIFGKFTLEYVNLEKQKLAKEIENMKQTFTLILD